MTPEQYAQANEYLKRPDFPEHLRPKLEAKMSEYVQEKLVVKPPALSHETPQKKSRFDELDAIKGQGKVDPALMEITASGRKAFADSPPEYSPGGALDAFRMKYVLEPTVKNFREEMRGTLGDRVDVLGENSIEFQEYSDRLWQKELQRAKAEGKPVSRQKFITGPKRILAEAGGAATSFGLGAADIGSAGILTGGGGRLAEAAGDEGLTRSNQERVREEYPVSSFLGGVAGAFSPTGLPSLAAKAGWQGVKRLAPNITKGALREAAAAGAVGSGVAGTESVVRDAAYGNDVSGERAALAASLGFPLAAGGSAIGRVAGKSAASSADRPGMRDVIYPADEAGIAFGPAMGVRTPGVAQKLRDKAIAEGHAARVPEYAVSQIEKPFAKAARGLQEAEGLPSAQRLKLSQGLQHDKLFEPTNTGNAVLEFLESNVQSSGRPEPFVRNLNEIRREAGNIFDSSPALDQNMVDQLMKSRPNGKVYTRAEAERLGLDGLLRGKKAQFLVLSPAAKNPEKLDEMIRRIDDLADADRLARGGKGTDPMYERLMAEARKDRDLIPAGPIAKATGQPLAPSLEYELGSGQRVKGYSALHTDAATAISKGEARNAALGLPNEIPEIAPRPVGAPGAPTASPSDAVTKATTPQGRAKIPGKGEFREGPIGEPVPKLVEGAGQWDRFRGKLLDLSRTGGSPAARKAALEVANFKPELGLLRELGALRGVGLEEAAEGLAARGGLSANLSTSGNTNLSVNPNILNRAAYHSLPMRAALGGEEGYGGNLLTDLGKKMSPSLRGILRRMRGQGMPEAEARGRFGDSAMYRAKSPNLSRFALRGGRTGGAATAGDIPEAEEEQQLTQEDLKNLQILIEATQ